LTNTRSLYKVKFLINDMISIYKLMEKDWEIYCLMSGIAFIEEFSKPTKYMCIKNNKKYYSYHSIRLKMKNKETIDKWIKITRIWEKRLRQIFITDYFKESHKEKDQYLVYFLTNWLYHIFKEIKHLPSNYTNQICYERLINWKHIGEKDNYIIPRNKIKTLYKSRPKFYKLFKNKQLAAGALIISMDLECRGTQTGNVALCMSNTYKDFLNFMLKVANNYGWSTTNYLKKVDVTYGRNLGIKATNQSEFNLKISYLKEIYNLAGPLLDVSKDKAIKHHIKRSSNYVNLGGGFKKGKTKNKILNLVKKLNKTKTTELQYHVNIGIDVILGHLHNLEKEGYIIKERQGKRYIWSPINGNKPRT